MRLLMRSLTILAVFLALIFAQSAFAAGASNSAAFPPDIAAIKKQGVLTVAVYNGDMRPFFWQDADGHWTGIEIDLANMIAQQLQVKLQIVPVATYNDIIDMVAANQVDMGLGLITITPQRALQVRFTNPYYMFHPHLLINRILLGQQGWTIWNAATEIENSDQVLKLGALEDSANVDLLQEAFPNATIVGYPNMDAVFNAVIAGQVFAGVGNAPQQVHNWLAANPTRTLRGGDVAVDDKTVLIGMALPWQDESFRQWLNVYLQYIQMNNIKEELFAKYGEQDVEP